MTLDAKKPSDCEITVERPLLPSVPSTREQLQTFISNTLQTLKTFEWQPDTNVILLRSLQVFGVSPVPDFSRMQPDDIKNYLDQLLRMLNSD